MKILAGLGWILIAVTVILVWRSPAKETSDLPSASANPQIVSVEPPKALPSYCDWVLRSEEIYRQADQKFGQNVDGEQCNKKQEWRRSLDAKAAEKLSAETGLDYATIQGAASEGNWEQRCIAREAGLISVDEEQAKAASQKDSSVVRDALELYYHERLKSDPDHFFDPEKYSTVRCRELEIDGFRFVGCNLISRALNSGDDVYLVSSVNGNPVVTTFDTSAREKLADNRALQSAEKELLIGQYINYPVPGAFIKAEQEFSKN